MPLFGESKQEIFSDVVTDLLSNSNITEASPGSTARAIIEAVTNKMGDMWTKFDLNMAHAFIDGAEGVFLDRFGEMFGLSRNLEAPARVGAEDQVLRFFVTSNAPSTITIPAGTIVSTELNASGVTYITTSTVQVVAGTTEIYAPATSRKTGARGNVAKGTLNHHNIDNVDLKVTNEADVTTGRSMESDANFRFRIANQVLSSETGNYTAIRMTALGVEGVADVVMMPFWRGVGTFDILIKAITPQVSNTLLSNVRRALHFVVSQGVSFNVRKPKETGVSMQVTIKLIDQVDDTNKQELKNRIRQRLFDYINNLDIGEQLSFSEITQRVMSVSDNISYLGSDGRPIDSITVYKETDLSTTKVPETLFFAGDNPVNYTPATDEKLLIELEYIATENPIVVIIK
ncbi:hypothetical protein CMI41_03800 [Candidatus Pacearchaeota archaeon]|nr:hypothetical protein [Candidatus Pacearchaeota archaeon]|tara:strand:- start:8068 stop:9273 length:1206 start_codon:yes stop_codon:yes gene_type:complete